MITLLEGDCVDILPTLPESSVQCVVTSPPYYALRDYGLRPTLWPTIEYTPLAGLPPIVVQGCAADCAHDWGAPVRAPWANDIQGPNGRRKNTAGSRTRPKESGNICVRCGGWRGSLGLDLDPLAYVAHLVCIFRLVWRVLRDDGTCWINIGDSSAPAGRAAAAVTWPSAKRPAGLKEKDLLGIPWRLAFALQADGWYLRSDIVWHKPNCMPESVRDRPTKAHEYLFLLAKSERYYYDADAVREPQTGNSHSRGNGVTPKTITGHHERIKANESFHRSTSRSTEVPEGRNRRTVWSVPSRPTPYAHYATFPEKLVEPCILAGSRPGDTILDPFAGTFTVGKVARQFGRRAIGIELSPEYAQHADDRTDKVQIHMESLL